MGVGALDPQDQRLDDNQRRRAARTSGRRRPRTLPARDRVLQRWAWARQKTLSATSEFATAATRAANTPPTFPSPLFTGGQTGLSVRENAGVRTVVGVAPQATDMQGGTLSYSLAVDGFTSDPPFEINATSRQIRVVRAVLNHEGRTPTASR